MRLAAVPFFVHMVTNASEMTQFADIVLPSTFNAAEGMSVITNMGNTYGYASIQQPVGKRLWDVKQEETEVVWLLAAKLRDRGLPEPVRLLRLVQGSGDGCRTDQREGVRRNRCEDLHRTDLDAKGAVKGRQDRRLGRLP